MSRWHALDGTIFGAGAPGVVVEFWRRTDFEDLPTTIGDPLADPDEEMLADSAGALLPLGAAWSRQDGEVLSHRTVLWRFWRAASVALATAYRDAWRVTMDSTSVTLAAALDDWEDDFGLPDPCVGVYQSDAKRRRWLREKVLSAGVISPGDFLNLADALAFPVVIEEPEIFECGLSDSGGSSETGTPAGNHLVVFWVLGAGEYGFEAGIGEAGFTPLYDFDQASAVECRFRALLPAGFWPVFDYSELATFSGWPEIWPTAWE